MKSTERLVRVLVRILLPLALIVAGCTSGSEPGADLAAQTATDVSAETPVPAETPAALTNTPDEPTAAVEPAELTDADRIDAAVAALDRDGTSGLIAWDILDSTVRNDGNVTLTLCGWTGDTVFDQVYTSIWNIEDTIGTPALASEINTSPTAGDCLNTQLIDTALATVEEFEAYWVQVLAQPSSFKLDERSQAILTDDFFNAANDATDQWAEDGLYFSGLSAALPADAAVAEPLYRRFRTSADERLEIVTCRTMDSSYGAYIGDSLVDDGRATDDPGLHTLDATVLVLSDDEPGLWLVELQDSLIWSDCLALTDWPEGASAWRPENEDFQELGA